MSWHVEGTYFENCNCDFACPCTVTSFVSPATQDRCNVLLAFHVTRGEIDGLDVAGRSVALLADAPAQMTDGNWRVGLIVDDKASKEQVDKLAGVFSGQMGGPMGNLAPLVGQVLGVEQHPVEFQESGHKHHVRIGKEVDIEVEDFIPQGMTEPTRLAGVAHPANSTVTVAKPTTSRVNLFGIRYEAAGKSAFAAPFHWSG